MEFTYCWLIRAHCTSNWSKCGCKETSALQACALAGPDACIRWSGYGGALGQWGGVCLHSSTFHHLHLSRDCRPCSLYTEVLHPQKFLDLNRVGSHMCANQPVMIIICLVTVITLLLWGPKGQASRPPV